MPMDDEGLDLDALEAALDDGAPPAFLYTIPTFQNPSGRTLSTERRRRVVEIAAERGLLVLEDDPYGLVRFEGEAPPSLLELSNGRVAYSSSFSKTIAPGLRVGYFVLPRELESELEAAAVGTYITPALLGQATVHEFVSPRPLRAEPRAHPRAAEGAAGRDARRARAGRPRRRVVAARGRLLRLARRSPDRASSAAERGRRVVRPGRRLRRRGERRRGSPSASRPPDEIAPASSGSRRRSRSRSSSGGGDGGGPGDEARLRRRPEHGRRGAERRAGALAVRARRALRGGSSSRRRSGRGGLRAASAGVEGVSGIGGNGGDPTAAAEPPEGGAAAKFADFPAAPKLREPAGFYCSFGRVASARNACRKVFTGTMRSPSAYFRASAAFSPAGTRKTSTPVWRAPIVFCFTPPTGPTCRRGRSRRSRRPCGRGRRPGRAPPSPRARRRAPADGPPTWPASMLTFVGSRMSYARLDEDPDDGPRRPASHAHGRDRELLLLAVAADREPDDVARLVLRHPVRDVRGRAHGRAVDADQDVADLQLSARRRFPAGRRRPRRRWAVAFTFRPSARRATAAAICCERVISPQVDPAALLVVHARRDDAGRAGTSVGAVAEPGDQALEQRRLAHDHVDEVDAAGAGAGRGRPGPSRAARPDARDRGGRCTRSTGGSRARGRPRAGRGPP